MSVEKYDDAWITRVFDAGRIGLKLGCCKLIWDSGFLVGVRSKEDGAAVGQRKVIGKCDKKMEQ